MQAIDLITLTSLGDRRCKGMACKHPSAPANHITHPSPRSASSPASTWLLSNHHPISSATSASVSNGFMVTCKLKTSMPLPSAHSWLLHSVRERLPFTSETFDYVHIRFVGRGVPEDAWSSVFKVHNFLSSYLK